MTKEEKELLLKDICSRLPYELWLKYENNDYIATGYGHGRISLLTSMFSSTVGPCPLIIDVKPYLRPMSSMTEEESRELGELITIYDDVDWMLAHHFDVHNLIEKGLALEAKEGMYSM